MDDSIRTAKYTPLNYHYSRVCLVCGETERYSSPTTATIVDTSLPWLCDRCRETLLKLIEDANTSNALNALEQENEELTDTNVGKWIPVTERLPSWGEDVLIAISGFANVGHIVQTNDEKQYNWFYSGWYHDPWEVTHWMPLPDPPKEE